jgi:hypothetical protein
MRDTVSRESFFSGRVLVGRKAITYVFAPPVNKLLLLLACALPLSLGCAASTAIDDDGGLDGDIVDSAGNKDAAKKDTGPTGQCIQNCTSDQDCQNSCPLVPQGVNCCDTATGICYAYAQTSCPAPVPDASLD